MSVIREIPYIEKLLGSMSLSNLRDLKTILDTGGNNVKLDFANLNAATYKNKVTPVYFQFEDNSTKSAILIWNNDYCSLICYHRFQDLLLIKLDTNKHTYEKINEYCDINELRRILDDSLETVGENILNIESSSGELEDSDIEALKLPNAAIEYNDTIYYKDTQDDNEIVFKALPRVDDDTTYLDVITIDLSNNTYTLLTSAIAAGEGFTPTYDTELSDISTNAVQNKTIVEALEEKADVEEISDGTIVADKANKDGNGNIITTTYAKQTKVDALETSIGQIQEQIAGSNIEIPEEKISYQTVIPETLEYNDLIYKRNDKVSAAILSKLGGLTKKYNQLLVNGDFEAGVSNWSAYFFGGVTSWANGVLTLTHTSTGDISQALQNTIPSGHKVIFISRLKTNDNNNIQFGAGNDTSPQITTKTTFDIYSSILTLSNNLSRIYLACVGTNIVMDVDYIMLIDLTTIYGAGNEPSTVDDFLNDYPIFRGYVPYTTGAMDYAYTKKVDVVGFNIWDEEWELGAISSIDGNNISEATTIRSKNYIKVIPNANIYYKSPYYCNVRLYDSNKNYLGYDVWSKDSVVTIPSNVSYVRFITPTEYGTTYNHDICINVSNTTLNGTYKPSYRNTLLEAKIVAIKQKLVSLGYSADVLGYGLPNVYNYIDLENKQVVLKMLDVDLGEKTWGYTSANRLFSASLPLGKTTTNLLCSLYTPYELSGGGNDPDKCVFVFQATLYITNSDYTDTITFKQAMSGVPLIYELATPITVDVSDILDNDDVIGELESGGTITFENDDMYPVVSNIKYYCYNVEESIIEGDSDSNTTGTDITLSDEYIHYQQTAGALMFVVAGKFTIADTISAGSNMLTSLFTIDETAGQYIYPIEDENVDFNIVDCSKDVIVNPTTLTTNADTISVLEKGSNTSIRYRMVANENIEAGSYVFRFAITLKL